MVNVQFLLALWCLWWPAQASASVLVASHGASRKKLRSLQHRETWDETDPIPGDVSGVTKIQSVAAEQAQQASEVATEIGGVVAEKVEGGVEALKESILDPVGTIGGAVDTVAEVVESGEIIDTPSAEGVQPAHERRAAAAAVEAFRSQLTTAPPAPFGGVFCRGGACQYRKAVQVRPGEMPTVAPAMPEAELCRGLSCPGLALEDERAKFITNCSHIFNGLGKGLHGTAEIRSIGDVRDSFLELCNNLMPLEADSCPDYAQIFVASLAESVESKTVGDTPAVCGSLQALIRSWTQAEFDLRLSAASFPSVGGAASSSMLAAQRRPRAVGPCTANGQVWRKWWEQRHGRAQVALLQQREGSGYDPNPPCSMDGSKVEVYKAPPQRTMYVVAPGAPDGSSKPVEVRGDVFIACRDQMDEVTLRAPRPPATLIQMLRDWCGVQSMAGDPDDPNGLPRHPDWTGHSCTNMGELLAIALRKDAKDSPLGSLEVCKRLFLATRTFHRVEQIIKDAWALNGRNPPPVPEEDAGQKQFADAAKKAADAIYAKMAAAEQAKEAAKAAKEQAAAWGGSDTLPTKEPPTTPPPLPSVEETLR